MSEIRALQTFRRAGTALFGVVAIAALTGLFLWAVLNPELKQTWADYAFGGAVGGAMDYFVFCVTVWPAVVLRPGAVVVRNPLVDHELIGGSPRLVEAVLGGVAVVDGGMGVPVFALSSSLLDRLMGSRTTKRLVHALDRREPGTGPAVVQRDRLRIVRQAPAFVATNALVGVLAHLVQLHG